MPTYHSKIIIEFIPKVEFDKLMIELFKNVYLVMKKRFSKTS